MSHDMNILEISDDFSVRQVDNVVLGRQENRIPQFGGVSDDGRLYISNLIDNTVTVMVYDHDADSARIQSYLSVGIAPADIEVIGDKIYVCNSAVEYPVYGQGSVSVIESNIESKRIPVGINAQFMALDPDGRLHVVCTGNYNDIAGKVYVIKTDIDAIAQVIELRGKPGDIAITSDGQAYVAAGGWAYNEDPFGVVYRYNAVTGEILNGPDNPIEVGLGASRVVIGEEGAVYVSCWDANRVDKIIGEERVDSYEVGTNPTPMLIFKP